MMELRTRVSETVSLSVSPLHSCSNILSNLTISPNSDPA